MIAIDAARAGAGASPSPGRLLAWVRGATAFPEETATFSRPFRRVVLVLAVASLPAGAVAATGVAGQAEYLGAAWMSLGLQVPALVLSAVAARRARPDGEARFWWCWTVAVASVTANGVAVWVVAARDVGGLRALAPVAVGVTIALFMVSNTVLMRRRSGGRLVGLDAVETAIATTVLSAGLVLAIGDRLLDSPVPWYTWSCLGSLIGGIVGLFWVTVLFHRTPRGHRRLELVGIGLGVAAVVDASAQLAEGLSGFTLAPVATVFLHGITLTLFVAVPLHAARVAVPGLQRLAPQRQVRGGSLPTVLALAAVPALAVLALARRPQVPWAGDAFAFDAALLAVLLAVRALLALRETTRLYGAVAAGADERQRLLTALTRSFDGDRHRVAAQLHEQAIASYATFATYLQSASRSVPGGVPLPRTSEQVRAHLGRTAELWREFMLAVRQPGSASPVPAVNLRVAIVAHVVAVTGEEQVPALSVEVDPELYLDWATEALVLRIVQEAVTYLHRLRLVIRVAVGVSPGGDGFELRLAATGARRDPGPCPSAAGPGGEPGTAAIVSFAAAGNGELHVEHRPTETVVSVALQRFGARPAGAEPHLRVVSPADSGRR